MNISKITITLVVITFVSGCATRWVKPGGTTDEFEATKASCISRAYARFPPMEHQVQLGNGYTTPSYTNCYGNGYGGGYNANCTTTGGQYVPPATMTVDSNQQARNQDVRSCFFENGWTPERN